jgi:pimeloyl-ACP methyl ester carboxylesterase
VVAVFVLIHGGLWEDMDSGRFWEGPGIVGALRGLGHEVVAPDRVRRPRSWQEEVDHLAPLLPAGPLILVAGSNGCSLAVHLVLAFPGLARRLVLAWPAGAGSADERYLASFSRQGAPAGVAEALLAGDTLRGVTDADLAGLRCAVAVLPSDPPNVFHQRATSDRLLRLIPGAIELPGCPEAPRPEFPAYLGPFVSSLDNFAAS